MPTRLTRRSRMAQVQGNNLLDVLKKKMRQTKEEMEKYKEESEDMGRKLQVEICRREPRPRQRQTSMAKSSPFRTSCGLDWAGLGPMRSENRRAIITKLCERPATSS